MEGMEPNPYEAPAARGEQQRQPWVGILLGLILFAAGFALPIVALVALRLILFMYGVA